MKKALVFIFALLCALTSYAQQFRLVGNLTGFATVVDDSTYNVSLSFPSDLTGNSFLPTQIADDGSYRIFFQTGRIYTVTGVANATFSAADLTLVEYGSTDGSPTGQALVFNPQGRESVPQAPIAASGASGILNAAIISYNLQFQQGFADGDSNDLVLNPGIELESTTYTDAQALFTAIVASLNTKVDTLYERSDSLFYQVGGVETLFAVDTGGGGSLVDGDYGDVTVSGSGTVITINGQAVTFAKFQDIPENTFVGRDEAGTGSAETLTPAEARTLLNVEDGATADQTATDVPITDAGAYYTGTDVEAALQEVADTLTDLRTDLSAIASGAADGVATAGAYDGPNEEIDVTVAAPGADFSIDVSSLASDSELGDSTAQVRSEIPTTASDLPIVDAGGYYTTSDVESALQEEAVNRVALDQLVGDLIVLSGVPITSQDLGTFTGTTITDDNTIKGALQELETAVESAGGATSIEVVTSALSYTVSADNQNTIINSDVTNNDVLIVLPDPKEAYGNIVDVYHNGASELGITLVRAEQDSLQVIDLTGNDTTQFVFIAGLEYAVRFISKKSTFYPDSAYWVAEPINETLQRVGDELILSEREVINISPYLFQRSSQNTSLPLNRSEVVTLNYSLPYTGNLSSPARGAYSVRRIYISYTGPAFTVENNAGDTLQVNFLPGLGSVYDTTAVLAFDDTVYVKRWYDQSGFGNHLEVTALSGSGKGPYLVRNGALVKDNEGQLAVRFINTELSCLSTLTDPWGEHTAYSFGARFQDTGTNLGPFASARGATNDGFSMYYTGGDLRIAGNGYQIASGGPYAVGTIANVAPANTPNNIFAVLSADTVNVWNDGTPVTLSAAVTGSVAPTTLNDTLFVMGRNTNGATSFWYYDGYVSEVLIWGQDASLDEEAVSQGIVDYYDNALPLDASSSSIVITLPVPSASNLNKSVDITHNGQQGESTIVKTESGIGYFLYRESVLDSIEISSTGNASVTLRVTQDFDDNYYYQLVATTEIDSRLLDSIDVRLDPQFVYASQYNTIDLAVEAAKAESKTLVVDVLKSKTGTLDLDSLTVMVAQGGFLSVDTLTANGAILISPGPRKFLNNDTRVEGQWNTVGNTYIEWTSNVPSDSISTWNALRNAVVMGEVELMNKTYRVNKQGNNDIQDSPIIINGQGEGESVLVLTNPGQHFTGTTKGSPLSISNCTIVTSNFEQGNYNNNTAYIFAQSLRSNTNEDLVTDIPFFRLNNVALKGEVKFTYGMSGTETTKPDSVTFANSGVKSVEIKNSSFEGVRDVVSLNNTFARKAVVEHNEVYNLFGAFYSQLSTLADSLDSPYRISDIDFEHNLFLNDSIITYSGGAYLSPLVVKARNVNFNDNDITGIRKINTGADVHVCYPSVTGSYWATNNRIRNVWETGEGSAFKFKGAVEAHVNNNKFTIDREELLDAGLIDASGFLIDSTAYAFALVDKEDQNSYTKVLEMRDNDIQVPIWNKSTTVRDVSSLKLVDNNFYFGRIEAEPPAGWAGNTLSNTIFYSSQTSALVDTLSAFISKGNVWTVESVENDYISFLEYTTVTNSTNRLTPIAYFDDVWNVDNVSVHYMPPYSDKYVNKSKIAGSGQFKIMQGGGLTGAKGYSFEQGEIDLTILESDYINAYPSDALLPLTTNLNANIEIKKVSADTLLLLSGRQNDWSSGWIGASEPIFVQIEANYVDTAGVSQRQVWRLNYTTDVFAINHYNSSGALVSYNPQSLDSIVAGSGSGIILESVAPGGSKFHLRLRGLNIADNCKLSVRVSPSDFSLINVVEDSETLTIAGGEGIDTEISGNTVTTTLDLSELSVETSLGGNEFFSFYDSGNTSQWLAHIDTLLSYFENNAVVRSIYNPSGLLPDFGTYVNSDGAGFEITADAIDIQGVDVTVNGTPISIRTQDTLFIPIYAHPHDEGIVTGSADYRGWRVPADLNGAKIEAIQYSFDTPGSDTVNIQLTNGTVNIAGSTIPIAGYFENTGVTQTLTTGEKWTPSVSTINGTGHEGLMVNLMIVR